MRYLHAGLVVVLAGIVAGMVFTDAIDGGGSSKTRAVKALANAAVDQFGATGTVWGVVALGLGVAAVILWTGSGREESFGRGRRDWPARAGD